MSFGTHITWDIKTGKREKTLIIAKLIAPFWGGYHQGWHDAVERLDEGKSLANWFQVR